MKHFELFQAKHSIETVVLWFIQFIQVCSWSYGFDNGHGQCKERVYEGFFGLLLYYFINHFFTVEFEKARQFQAIFSLKLVQLLSTLVIKIVDEKDPKSRFINILIFPYFPRSYRVKILSINFYCLVKQSSKQTSCYFISDRFRISLDDI